MGRDLVGDGIELIGLVAEDDEVGLASHLYVGRRHSAELLSQRGRATGAGIGAEHGLSPAARQRACHVPGSDQPNSHVGKSIAGRTSPRLRETKTG